MLLAKGLPEGFEKPPESWIYETGRVSVPAHLRSDSSLESLHLFCWSARRPEGAPVTGKTLWIVHGHGEHSARYAEFVSRFQDSVDRIEFLDLRGHGRSEATRGHVESFSLFTQDLEQWIQARTQAGVMPQSATLLGHSLGGLIVLDALRNSAPIATFFDRAVVSAPLLKLKLEVPWYKSAPSRLLSKVFPKLQMSSELNAVGLSSLESVQKRYLQDPLVHSKVTPRFFVELQQRLQSWSTCTQALPIPTLFLIPMADPIVDPNGALALFSRVHRTGVDRLRTWPDFRHESFNEARREEAYKEVNAWIQIPKN